jgi:hypothetical protein
LVQNFTFYKKKKSLKEEEHSKQWAQEKRIVSRLCALFNGKVLFEAVTGSPTPKALNPPTSEVSMALVSNKVDPAQKSVSKYTNA